MWTILRKNWENKMKKTTLNWVRLVSTCVLLTGCAGDNYSNSYNSYDNRSYNDRQIDNAITSEINSLTDADIATLNTLK